MKSKGSEILANLEAIDFSKRVLHRKNVVIIDDDENQQQLIKAYIRSSLEGEKYELHSCLDAKSALVKLFQKDYDLIIIDINLPSTLGFKIGELVRDVIPYEIPIIYISADRENLREFRKMEHKKTTFLLKPFEKDDLVDVMESFAA